MLPENFLPTSLTVSSFSDLAAATSDILQLDEDTIEAVDKRIKDAENSDAINIFYSLLKNIFLRKNKQGTPFTILIENYYVDPVYRDSYYFHYATKHLEYNRYCMRLFFLDVIEANIDNLLCENEKNINKNFIGVCTLRPASDRRLIIGKTLLNPQFFKELKKDFICTTNFQVTMFGKRLKTKAFPYMMQDAEVITCAETTILHLLDYFSNKYNLYRTALPFEISQIEQKISEQRVMPSQGLQYTAVSHILSELNFYPCLYGFDEKMLDIKRKRIMHYYIDSAIPVAVSLKPKDLDINVSHSIVGIGISYDSKNLNNVEPIEYEHRFYLDSADICEKYIVMNDSSVPYTPLTFTRQDSNQFNIKIKSLPYNFSMNSLIAPLSKHRFFK